MIMVEVHGLGFGLNNVDWCYLALLFDFLLTKHVDFIEIDTTVDQETVFKRGFLLLEGCESFWYGDSLAFSIVFL